MEIAIQARQFDLQKSATCAQAFRWKPYQEGFFGVAQEKAVYVRQENDQLILTMQGNDVNFWEHYFALDADYSELEQILVQDEKTAESLVHSRGIHIFRQDPFEALISFILSANNNFSRICSLVERLSNAYGEKHCFFDIEYHAFPSREALSVATESDLQALGVGYRAAYLVKTMEKLSQGYDLQALKELPYEEAIKELETFSGVGNKVANCIALFSLDFSQAFPVDVWVKRILEYLYPELSSKEAVDKIHETYGEWAGIMQQYLFHYARAVQLGK